ncbi:hypothetical protein K469DRAFT_356398 [Zopfia rhizophila CBS 207.26]|uniref:Uncharacterized protein n=1 Tax=Zopfia rhizophila CBS 207.26 TaxID=1314779 RepID=A0A6A6DH87_9PEZI|nr:hypothetical protein K469DRAFT_356398 [Zopfia rhizophila CBS 207.26]
MPNSSLAASPIFNPESGFGGNGIYFPGDFTHPPPSAAIGPPNDLPDRTGGECITDRPFKDTVVHIGPGIRRNSIRDVFNETLRLSPWRITLVKDKFKAGSLNPIRSFYETR